MKATYTSFDGFRRIALGALSGNALAVKAALESGATGPVLLFDDRTGAVVDLDLCGSAEEVAARFDDKTKAAAGAFAMADEPSRRGRGRPKLGVVAREVTLLPRHWEWLAAQPGGASVALRKLVEAARRTNGDKDRMRQAHERAYRFMSAIAGDLPGFEEAARALFAGDEARLSERIGDWPEDVREYVLRLASG